MRGQEEEVRQVLKGKNLDSETKDALAIYFKFASDRYFRLRNALIVLVCIVTIGCSAGIQQGYQAGKDATNAVNKLNVESRERRDQSCQLTERTYKRNVDSIKTTYTYIESLNAKQLKDPLTQLIIKQLPKTYADAKISKAPPFCSEKGIGLPGPAPTLPPLKTFKNLLVVSNTQ